MWSLGYYLLAPQNARCWLPLPFMNAVLNAVAELSSCIFTVLGLTQDWLFRDGETSCRLLQQGK